MKWSLMFKEKMKAAIILVILMLSIIFSNIVEKRIDKTNTQRVSSFYQDRLTPAVDLFLMRDINEKRIFTINQFKIESSKTNFSENLKSLNQEFNQLLNKYQLTFLVNEEKEILNSLNENYNKYLKIEHDVMVDSPQYTNASVYLNIINNDLTKLSKLQESIGNQILTSYKKESFWIQFLNNFQIVIAIIIGLIILQMVSNSTLISKLDNKQKHHLN